MAEKTGVMASQGPQRTSLLQQALTYIAQNYDQDITLSLPPRPWACPTTISPAVQPADRLQLSRVHDALSHQPCPRAVDEHRPGDLRHRSGQGSSVPGPSTGPSSASPA